MNKIIKFGDNNVGEIEGTEQSFKIKEIIMPQQQT